MDDLHITVKKWDYLVEAQGNQTYQESMVHITRTMARLLGFTIAMGSLLMIMSLFYPIFVSMTLQNLNATKAAELALSDEGLANASQNVLPFATGLIGFSAGIITVYGKTTTPERTYGAPPPPEQLPTPTPPSTPTHTGGAPVGG